MYSQPDCPCLAYLFIWNTHAIPLVFVFNEVSLHVYREIITIIIIIHRVLVRVHMLDRVTLVLATKFHRLGIQSEDVKRSLNPVINLFVFEVVRKVAVEFRVIVGLVPVPIP